MPADTRCRVVLAYRYRVAVVGEARAERRDLVVWVWLVGLGLVLTYVAVRGGAQLGRETRRPLRPLRL